MKLFKIFGGIQIVFNKEIASENMDTLHEENTYLFERLGIENIEVKMTMVDGEIKVVDGMDWVIDIKEIEEA